MPSMMPVEPKRDRLGVALDVLALIVIVACVGGFGVTLWFIGPVYALLFGFGLGAFAGVRLATRGR